MDNEIAPHVQEIKRALDKKDLDETKIADELKKLLTFRVPLEEAKRCLIKQYGGYARLNKKLNEIQIGDQSLEIIGRITDINSRTVIIKNTEKTIYKGVLSDESAAIGFTAWDDFGLRKGDVVRISHVYVRNWQDKPDINISSRSKVVKMENTLIPESAEPPRTANVSKKISELKEGAGNFDVVCKILEVNQREMTTKDGKRTIFDCVVADESGKLPMTAWIQNPAIKAGNSIKVENAYIRMFRGIPTLNVSEESSVTIVEDIKCGDNSQKLKIEDIVAREGAFDVIVEGYALSVRPGSGIIMRCPVCSRVIQKSTCMIHGKVKGNPDMRIKTILDDGTGSITLVLDANLTGRICGYKIDEANRIAQDNVSHNAIEEDIKKKLIGKALETRGNVSKTEYGITLVATSVSFAENDVRDRAIKLLEKIRGDNGKND